MTNETSKWWDEITQETTAGEVSVLLNAAGLSLVAVDIDFGQWRAKVEVQPAHRRSHSKYYACTGTGSTVSLAIVDAVRGMVGYLEMEARKAERNRLRA